MRTSATTLFRATRSTSAMAVVGVTLALFGEDAAAGTIVVPDDQQFLGVAIEQALDGDTIVIRHGIYAEATEFTIVGKRLTIMAESADAEVIISGAGIHRAMLIEGAGADGTVIDGITFTEGLAPGNGEHLWGGGVFAREADVTFIECAFVANTAQQAGGGLAVQNGIVRLERCDFLDNTLLSNTGDGAGAFITANTVPFGSTQVVVDCHFEGNSTPETAGGLRIDWTHAQVSNCSFVNNTAGVEAGAYYARKGDVHTLDHCTFIGNSSGGNGGVAGFSDVETSAIFRNCVFRENSAANEGGVFHVGGSTVTALNCTVVDNTAGDHVLTAFGAVGQYYFTNVIIDGNVPVAIPFEPGGGLVVRYSLVEGGQAGEGNLDVDPMLNDDLMPMAGSPVIDAGSSDLYEGPFSDYAGGQRGMDDPAVPDTGVAVMGPVVDMGAIERQVVSTSSCPSDINGDGAVDGADLGILLGAWGNCF